jgi:predicted esterase
MKTCASTLALFLFLVAGVPAEAGSALEKQLAVAGENAAEIRGFLEAARAAHGDLGERAAVFLIEGMPARDLASLSKDFLLENLALALKARSQFAWAREVPEAVFFNDVLPYASLDETRESWRPDFHMQCEALVKDCRTATEAAQALNQGFFQLIQVHYNTGRKAPNQSPSESKALGMATCTGLSIILVDACRSVGVPARIAGTALWANKRGNHTWVEIHDRGEWFFTGADEYNEGGLNRAWFKGDASQAIEGDWKHAIWATSWQETGSHFPMVWNLDDKSVPGVNVTARYAAPAAEKVAEATVYLRAWDVRGGTRLAVAVDLLDATGKTLQSTRTRAGTADLNDMASLKLRPGENYRLRLVQDGEERSMALQVPSAADLTQDLIWSELGGGNTTLTLVKDWLALLPEERHLSIPEAALTKAEAEEALALLWTTWQREAAATRSAELEAKVVKAAGKEMRYLEKTFGSAKAGERSLFLSMHGGGGAPTSVNDQQWQNQIRLYAPKEGIVVAPRAPTDTWNLWHEGHIDDLFDRLIANFVLGRGVSPDRVYLLGYSAGGDGVYQLAPRMADRFAAAAMMAGHPNDASPLGLRNLPFMIFMGGDDGAYKRNEVARAWGEKLDALRKEDPTGYEHKVTIYEGLGHWMNGKDAEALPWMSARTRTPWPKRVVWHQSGRTHERFYWLSVPKESAKRGQVVRATVEGQRIEIQAEGLEHLTLGLHDELVDLDRPVVVILNGKKAFEGTLARSVRALWESLRERPDPRRAATALWTFGT